MEQMSRLFLTVFLMLGATAFAQRMERNLGAEKWLFAEQGQGNFHAATVPGTVHTDLFKNSLIPDPFYGDNEKRLQWIEEKNWTYKTSFNLTQAELNKQNIEMIFEGLDTYADVFLNGTKILSADNMFRTWKTDVKKYLKPENTLEVIFSSSSAKAKQLAKLLPYTLPENERMHVRKAQYQFGWDWGPRYVTAGIWKPAKLVLWDHAKISNIKTSQTLSENLGTVNFITEIEAVVSGTYQLDINGKKFKATLKKGNNLVKSSFSIKNPKLWYPNGFGEPHLYPFKITLEKNGKPIDQQELNIGLRDIKLVQEKDKDGKTFYFTVNGIPVYAKGTNVIPPHSFIPSAGKGVYQMWMEEARRSHMNMIRVWGGGIYPDDEFFHQADKNGILIWQDFMFAGTMYPGDPAFLKNVQKEVADQVNRLQNHPSLALWCGNNEIDEGWHNWGWQKQHNYSKQDSAKIWNDYVQIFRKLIPATIDSVSAQKPIYWQSSPSNGWGRALSYKEGDVHYWGVWWGMEPFEKYREKTGRFVSEYGFQGMPPVSTLRTITNHLSFNDSGIQNHQKHAKGYATIQSYMERDYKVPSRFEDYAYVSQLLQARGMRIAVEAHRQKKPYNMGTLYWQLNDVWPVTSWSSIDYFGNRKAVQYETKRIYESLFISVEDTPDAYRIWLNNDQNSDFSNTAVIELISFEGKVLYSDRVAYRAAKLSNKVILDIPKGIFAHFNLKNAVLKMNLVSTEDRPAVHYFVKPKDLVLSKPNIKVTRLSDRSFELTTDVLAKDVYLEAGMNNFDDNFFDLLPNQRKVVIAEKPVQDLNIKTLNEIK